MKLIFCQLNKLNCAHQKFCAIAIHQLTHSEWNGLSCVVSVWMAMAQNFGVKVFVQFESDLFQLGTHSSWHFVDPSQLPHVSKLSPPPADHRAKNHSYALPKTRLATPQWGARACPAGFINFLIEKQEKFNA